MQNVLTNVTKKRLIQELRNILYEHPRYRPDSQNVFVKFGFEQRPQLGIIINNASADRVRLSADNYIGRISSFVMQAPVLNFPGTSVEWVIENKSLLEKYSPNRNIFPSPPGVYILEVLEVPNVPRNVPGQFKITPLLSVSNELLIFFSSPDGLEANLSNQNIYPGSVRLWMNGRVPLIAGVDFAVESETGLVTILKPTSPDLVVYADYRYQVPDQGPLVFKSEEADYKSIPGAVIAWGDRFQLGDKLAIVVGETRSETAEVYGGKFEVQFELLAFAKDPEEREKLSDFIVAKVLERQSKLGFDGLELLDISPGGESEEVYDATIDDYYYDGTISVGFRVDWEFYNPLPVEIFRAEVTSKKEEQEKGHLDGTYKPDLVSAVATPAEIDGIIAVGVKSLSFERIK